MDIKFKRRRAHLDARKNVGQKSDEKRAKLGYMPHPKMTKFWPVSKWAEISILATWEAQFDGNGSFAQKNLKQDAPYAPPKDDQISACLKIGRNYIRSNLGGSV